MVAITPAADGCAGMDESNAAKTWRLGGKVHGLIDGTFVLPDGGSVGLTAAPEGVYGARSGARAQAWYATRGVCANIRVSRSWACSDEMMCACFGVRAGSVGSIVPDVRRNVLRHYLGMGSASFDVECLEGSIAADFYGHEELDSTFRFQSPAVEVTENDSKSAGGMLVTNLFPCGMGQFFADTCTKWTVAEGPVRPLDDLDVEVTGSSEWEDFNGSNREQQKASRVLDFGRPERSRCAVGSGGTGLRWGAGCGSVSRAA
jgi:hypothetical protein